MGGQKRSWSAVVLPVLTRTISRFSFRAADRIARAFYSPDGREYDFIQTIDYLDDNIKIHVSTASFLEWSIHMFGSYEPHISRVAKRILRPGDTAVDVGANVGCHTLAMAKLVGHAGRVIALEPHPEIAERLRANLALNEVQNVTVRLEAASDRSERAILYARLHGDAGQLYSSLYEEHVGLSSRKFSIEARLLDETLAAEGVGRIRLIKIDTEGNEGKVLDGAAETINRHRPYLLFEYDRGGWKMAGYDIHQVSHTLYEQGYHLREIMARRTRALDVSLSDYANILAVPRRLGN